jgi:hypothetical protein
MNDFSSLSVEIEAGNVLGRPVGHLSTVTGALGSNVRKKVKKKVFMQNYHDWYFCLENPFCYSTYNFEVGRARA